MPDYGFIAQQQQPDTFRRIGEMVNFARGLTDLQQARATLPANIERARAESELARTAAGVAAATAQPRIEQQQAATAGAKTAAQTAQWNLDTGQAQKGYELLSGVAQDPAVNKGDSEGSVQALMHAEEAMRAHKIPEEKIRVLMGPIYSVAAHKPEALRQLLDNIVRGGSGAGTQAGVINTPVQPLSTGRAIVPFQPQPGVAGGAGVVQGAPQIPVAPSPQTREEMVTDVLGRPAIKVQDNQGGLSFKPPNGSSYKPLMTLPAGETPDTAKPLLALRETSQAAAANVPAQHFNNRQILDLADTAFTGTGSDKLAQIMNAYGARSSDNAASDTVKLQHFVNLQIVANAAAQGANTDQARQIAANAVIPGATPAQALKAITKINDAYATGTELFNKAMQATLANPGNQKDIFAIRDLQNAWAANMDPRIFQLENAVKAGDKAEVAALKKALGPQGINDLLRKARTLQTLVNQGAVGGP